jgi:hypothetical protein
MVTSFYRGKVDGSGLQRRSITPVQLTTVRNRSPPIPRSSLSLSALRRADGALPGNHIARVSADA